jgi:hypothetical protein
MTAPSATTRITPTGRKMGRGGPIYITFAQNADISLWEQGVTPPGARMDDRKDTSTSFNATSRTFSPGRLRTYEDVSADCGYDPDDLDEIYALLGRRDTITITFATGTKLAFYGWCDAISFNSHTEDDEPMVTLTIAVGNQDWTTCEEALPVLTAGTGTTASC